MNVSSKRTSDYFQVMKILSSHYCHKNKCMKKFETALKSTYTNACEQGFMWGGKKQPQGAAVLRGKVGEV